MAHGRYTVVRKLAEGGMAEIFLARQHGSEGFEKPVVLKRIHSGFAVDEQFRHMLVDEGHISMGLLHNNIVQVLDLGRARGRLFLALELVNGWDLSRILHRASTIKTWLPTGLAIYVLAETSRALSYAHGRTKPDGEPMGIVHRDISPQNILVSEQGEVKLADFGIAKALTKRERTATGVVKGKVAFMSPEQALGQEIDARSDLFSLGTLLYLLMTGVRPFEAPTDFEVIARVQKCVFTPPEEVRRDLPPAIAAIIRRAMAHDREQRYQTADELLVDLEGVLRMQYAGQTELKLWLAELSRRDGVPPIGRAAAMEGGDAARGDLGEGDALVLGEEGSGRSMGSLDTMENLPRLDGVDGLDDDMSGIDARRPTRSGPTANLKAVNRPRIGSGAAARVTGVEPTTMSAMGDVSLAVDDDAELGNRTRGYGRRRAFSAGVLLVLLACGGVGYGLWRTSAFTQADPVPPRSPGPAVPANNTPPAAAADAGHDERGRAETGDRRRNVRDKDRDRDRGEKDRHPEGRALPANPAPVAPPPGVVPAPSPPPSDPVPPPAGEPVVTPPASGEPTQPPAGEPPKTEDPAPASEPTPAPAP